MKNITVTVFQDGAGYYEAGYSRSINAAGITVIGSETVQYGALPECVTDPAQSTKALLHISVPGIGNLWIDETSVSLADKLNPACCTSGSGGGASAPLKLLSGDLSTVLGQQRITRSEFANQAVNAILVNEGTTKVKGISYTKVVGNSYLTFTDSTVLSAGDIIVFI